MLLPELIERIDEHTWKPPPDVLDSLAHYLQLSFGAIPVGGILGLLEGCDTEAWYDLNMTEAMMSFAYGGGSEYSRRLRSRKNCSLIPRPGTAGDRDVCR